ncbi:MAG TPA: DUF2771 family protein [Pseudonocardiaceae bacterium]|nr:DUF2771 family protein [Pseudonocardiaceae bacterium]
MRSNVVRSLALPLLAAIGLTVAGCSTPPPAFTVFVGNGSVQVPPTQYCDITGLRNCQANGAAATVVSVRDGQIVQVSAPESVATTPWQIAAEYKNVANGDSYVACSPLFPADQQYAYTVRPPSGDQLVVVEIYQSSTSLVPLNNGGFAALARGTWVLTNNANGSPTYPKAGDNLCEDQGS